MSIYTEKCGVDIIISDAANFGTYVPEMGISALPFLFSDFDDAWAFMDSEIQTVTVEIAEKSSSNNKPSKPSLNKKDHVEIFSGYPDGTFRPKKAMTRAEVAVVFSKLMKPAMVEGKTYTTNFSDVETGKWYSNAIGFMVDGPVISR